MTFDRNPSPAAETPATPATTSDNGRSRVVHLAPNRAQRRHGVVPADLRDRAVDEVLDRKARNGFLTNDDFHEIGQTVGRCGRSVRRWYDERIEGPGVLARERTRRGYRPDELAVTTLFACGGSVTAAYESLRGAGMIDVSLSTFRRGLKRLAGQLLIAARFGAQGVRYSALYLLWSAAKPNDVAQLDTHICDTFVRPTAATTEPSEAFRPRITVVIDDCTRLITGVLVTRGDPKAEQIAHTLALAFRVRDRDGTAYGGRADRVLVDNAMAHLSRQVIEGAAAIGVQLEVVAPYSPESKAKVERWFATFEAMVGRHLPGYVGGHAKNQKGVPQYRGEVQSLVTFAEYCAHVDHKVTEYNFARRHSTLGCTPFEAWAAHGIVPRKVDESLLARCCPEAGKGTYKVQRQGVHVEGRYYTGPALAGRVGDRVIVRRPSPDSTEVYAFAEDRTYLGALVPHAKLNDKERDAIIRHRAAGKEVTDSFFVKGHAVREEYNRDFVESNIAEIAERLEAEAAAGESIESSDAWAKDHRDMEDLDEWVSPDLDREARP